MTDKNDTADIAWMRKLAEEGSAAPFRGGAILLAAGLIFAAASVLHWSVVAGLIQADPTAFSFVWLIATVVFLLVVVVLRIRCDPGGVRTAANRASGAAWNGVGWGIFGMMASIAAITFRLGAPAALVATAMIPSVVLVFYGLGWAVSGVMNRSRFMTTLAGASLVAAPLIALLTGSPHQYLAYAAALILLIALPGFLLMRAAARADRAG